MLTILINAYACSPHMGSEPGMAWNWCVNLAKHCELHIITEGEFRYKIEQVVPTLPQGRNMHFYYNPVSEEIRRMCWNQGDWRFYKYYREWQWKTYLIAKDICQQAHIDILHQLNMIGFREPGYLWKIENKPFVWGPIGGLKQFPTAYLQHAGLKMKIFNRVKNIINIYQIKYDRRIDKAFKRADLLISSIPDSYRAIKKYKGLNSIIIPETGCFLDNNAHYESRRNNDATFNLLWVGKFDFRKQLEIALRTIAELKGLDIKLTICGSGNEKQNQSYKELASRLDIEQQVVWRGNIPNEAIFKEMCDADLFFFTSISEDTSTVVLEAISNHLPVLCFDTCGMGYVINEKVGMKIPLSNPHKSVEEFAQKITHLHDNPALLQQLAEGCKERQQELSWESKALQMIELYKKCLSHNTLPE